MICWLKSMVDPSEDNSFIFIQRGCMLTYTLIAVLTEILINALLNLFTNVAPIWYVIKLHCVSL